MTYYLLHTTYPILFLSVLARQLCLPVPAILFLLSAGALAGTGRLSFIGVLLVSVLGCLIGDSAWFDAGRLRGKRVLRLLCALAPDPSICIRRSRSDFARRGLPVLLIAKFVPGLDGITPPLAGMSGVSRTKFLLFDAGGSVLWSGAYIGAGFAFAAELDKVARYTSAIANILILILGVPLVFFAVLKVLLLLRTIQTLKRHHISPQQLKARIDAGQKLALLDLVRFEDDPQETIVIPGAIRADPVEMRRKRRIAMPEDVELVVYCSSRNAFVSARVAAVLHSRIGVERIKVLAGGLAAWRALGYPLATELADPFSEMVRLGIEMDPPPVSPQ